MAPASPLLPKAKIFQLSSLFAASDPDNNPLTYYVLDDTSGGGRFMINGTVQAEKQWVPVTQAQLSQTTFVAGQSGTDHFYFYASDGSLTDVDGVQLNAAAPAANQAPVVSPAERLQRHRFFPRPDFPAVVAVRRQRSQQRPVDLLRS